MPNTNVLQQTALREIQEGAKLIRDGILKLSEVKRGVEARGFDVGSFDPALALTDGQAIDFGQARELTNWAAERVINVDAPYKEALGVMTFK